LEAESGQRLGSPIRSQNFSENEVMSETWVYRPKIIILIGKLDEIRKYATQPLDVGIFYFKNMGFKLPGRSEFAPGGDEESVNG